jgi:competence protein ComEA
MEQQSTEPMADAANATAGPSDTPTVVVVLPPRADVADRAEAPRPEGADEMPPPVLWLRRSDQLVLAFLCACLLVLSAWHWARLSGWGMRPVEISRHPSRQYEYRIDINEATWVEWIQLPGIGEMLARRIVENREQNGPFQSVEDLQRVKGIGPKTVENLRPYLRAVPGQSGNASAD